jgi:hypothetical protein
MNPKGNGIGEVRLWLRDNYKRFKPTDRVGLVRAVMSKFGKTHHQAGDIILHMRDAGEIPRNAFLPVPGGTRTQPNKQPQPQTGVAKDKPFRMSIDIKEVQQDYDDAGKIDEGLKSLGTHLIRDNDFRLELGIQMDRWRIVSQQPKFAKCKRELKGKKFRGIYWAQASVLKQLAKKIDLL